MTRHVLPGVSCGVTVQRLGAMSLNPTPEKALAAKSDGPALSQLIVML